MKMTEVIILQLSSYEKDVSLMKEIVTSYYAVTSKITIYVCNTHNFIIRYSEVCGGWILVRYIWKNSIPHRKFKVVYTEQGYVESTTLQQPCHKIVQYTY